MAYTPVWQSEDYPPSLAPGLHELTCSEADGQSTWTLADLQAALASIPRGVPGTASVWISGGMLCVTWPWGHP